MKRLPGRALIIYNLKECYHPFLTFILTSFWASVCVFFEGLQARTVGKLVLARSGKNQILLQTLK